MTDQIAETDKPNLLELTTEIVAAHVSSNSVQAAELPNLIKSIHDALGGLGAGPAKPEPAKPQGAVSVRKSLSNPNHIISMIDGKPYKALRRHLNTNGHTPESYREAYGLPRDYPMTSPAYSEHRRAMAKQIGLGRKKEEPAPEPAKAPARRGRKPKALGDAVTAAKKHLGS